MIQKRSTASMMVSRLSTVGALLRYFTKGKRAILAPVLLVVLLGGVLLVVTGGLSYVAPFVYAIF